MMSAVWDAKNRGKLNIAPGTDVPVVIETTEQRRILRLLHWGLVPHWAKDPQIGHTLINARGESIATKPSFRSAFKRHRCLIPASGFYEWKPIGKGKQPYYATLKSWEIMALAGLWESWDSPDGARLETTCIVTTDANDLMRTIHDRMPVILDPDQFDEWLSGTPNGAQALVAPYASDGMQMWPVSREVNRAQTEGPSLIEAIPVSDT